MKNIIGFMLIAMLGTSCATGYGCPYTATETTAPATPKITSEPSTAAPAVASLGNAVVCQE